MSENIYCEDCVHLTLSERTQNLLLDGSKISHKCRKYELEVKHLGHHPNIMRIDKCLVENGKQIFNSKEGEKK